MALDFTFKSQFPTAQYIAAAQQKAAMEQQQENLRQQQKQERFNSLLNALSTASSLASQMQARKASALDMQQKQSEMQGQQNAREMIANPPSTIQREGPASTFKFGPQQQPLSYGQTSQYLPDTGSVVPNAMEQYSPQLEAALAQGFPTAYGVSKTKQMFEVPEKEKEQFRAQTKYVDPATGKTMIGMLGRDGSLIPTGMEAPTTVRQPKITKLPTGEVAEVITNEDGSLSLQSISGPKVPTPEQAGRLSMVSQAMRDIDEYKKMIVSDDGKINRKLLFSANMPFGGIPGTEGRTLNSYIENAVQSKLRIETGAAATTDEVKRVASRFKPLLRDKDATIMDKLQRLHEYMSTTLDVADPTGTYRKQMQIKTPSPGFSMPAADDIDAELNRRNKK